MRGLTRRLLAAGSAVVLAAPLAGCAAERVEDPKKLVVSTFGFASDRFEASIVKPFERATGIDVQIETGANADRLTKMIINRKAPTADVMMISDYFGMIGQRQGLFEKVDPARIPNLAKVYDFARDPAGYGPAYTYQLLGTMYRTDKVSKAEASSWKGMWNGRHKGELAVPDLSVSGGPTFLLAAGQTFGNGPSDAETGFRKLSELKPDVLKFFSRTTELSSLIDRGEVVMAPALDAFAVDAVKAGKPVAWTAPDQGRFLTANTVQMVKGVKNRAGAEKFIDHLLAATTQQTLGEVLYDKPVNREAKVAPLLTKVAGPAAGDPVAAGYGPADLGMIVENRQVWLQRFAQEVSG